MNISIEEKTYGAIIGYAAGDALGIGTEFMTRPEIKRRYPEGLIHYSQIIRDAHRSQWKRGDVSNDSLLACRLIESMCDNDRLDYKDYARRLKEWYLTDPLDLTANLRWVISQKDFTDDPMATSRRIWDAMRVDEAPSDALGRSIFTGMWDEDVKRNADDFCRITHPNSRCRVSAQIIATMANSLMWKNQEAPYEELSAIASDNEPEVMRYLEIARYGSLSDFNLDHEASFWYVRKCMGAALWAVWHLHDPNEALVAIVNEGGDADGNAGLATGLMCLKYGFSSLKKEYVDGLVQKDALMDLAARFTDCLTRNFRK